MEELKIEEVNNCKFIKGDFREELENDELPGLHLIDCDIISFDKNGVYFQTNGYNSRVYYTNGIGQIEQVLLDEYEEN